jgi:peptidoglycan/xylan/chitin deacetylase (PgdA/CDA1 family)
MHTFAQKPKSTEQTKSAKSTKPCRTLSGQSLDVRSILHLQRTIGNHAVQRLLNTGIEEATDKPITKENTTAHLLSDAVSSPGQPLDFSLKSAFESRFRHDFSQIQIHNNSASAQASRAIGARAFTYGRNIVFGEGIYRPHTPQGQHLLAHELAHVIQQSRSNTSNGNIGKVHGTGELEAEHAVAALGWGKLQPGYNTVALDVEQESGKRPLSELPKLSPASALIQRVQLTYDDGPDSAGNTQTVLTALNAAGARATFYLVGRRVAQGENWRIVFDIAAGGHWLGNHAYDWNDATDNHIFLHGTVEQRAQKILQTEWAIRDALIRGRDEAQNRKTWNTIPQTSRNYIEDVIAHGTGRFRTPGFRSHIWSSDDTTTQAAIYSVNQVLAASGLRPLAITEVSSWGISREGVTVDPEDWRSNRTQAEIEAGVTGGMSSNADSILLHSRIAASAAATPAIVADISRRGWSFDPATQGALGSIGPRPGFAGLTTISNPPTSAEISRARSFLRDNMLAIGPVLSGSVAIGIFQLAQRAGPSEFQDFAAEIRRTTVQTDHGRVPMANWLNANQEWRLFASFIDNWVTNRPFPRVPGVTI